MSRLVTLQHAEPPPVGHRYAEMAGLGGQEEHALLLVTPDEMVAAVERLRRARVAAARPQRQEGSRWRTAGTSRFRPS